MPEFDVTLVANDSSVIKLIHFSVPDDEWATMVDFKKEADDLRSTQFVQNRMGGKISVRFEMGKFTLEKSEPIDLEKILAMLMRLRPFVLNDEKTYFHKVKNIMKRWLEHQVFRDHLDALGDGFTLRTMQQKFNISSSEGYRLISHDVVMDWLNAFHYHRNASKRETLEDVMGEFLEDQGGAPLVLFSLADMIQSILGLSDLIETLMEVKDRVRNEISCDSQYLQS